MALDILELWPRLALNQGTRRPSPIERPLRTTILHRATFRHQRWVACSVFLQVAPIGRELNTEVCPGTVSPIARVWARVSRTHNHGHELVLVQEHGGGRTCIMCARCGRTAAHRPTSLLTQCRQPGADVPTALRAYRRGKYPWQSM